MLADPHLHRALQHTQQQAQQAQLGAAADQRARAEADVRLLSARKASRLHQKALVDADRRHAEQLAALEERSLRSREELEEKMAEVRGAPTAASAPRSLARGGCRGPSTQHGRYHRNGLPAN